MDLSRVDAIKSDGLAARCATAAARLFSVTRRFYMDNRKLAATGFNGAAALRADQHRREIAALCARSCDLNYGQSSTQHQKAIAPSRGRDKAADGCHASGSSASQARTAAGAETSHGTAAGRTVRRRYSPLGNRASSPYRTIQAIP